MFSTTFRINVGSNMSDKQFIDDTVKAHNECRRRHQASPLSHAKELSAQAQKWADHLAATNSFQHSSASLKGERLGENIAMKWSSQPDAYTGQDVTDQWYSEVKMHTFGGEPRTTGHFTQVVWRGSREVGVGRAVARDGKVIVVANYRPAGNLLGTYAANVLPPKDGKIVLPAEPALKPTTTTSQFSQGGTRTPEGTFSQRVGDARRDFFSQSQPSGTQAMGTRSQSKSVRTFTTTEGVGPNKMAVNMAGSQEPIEMTEETVTMSEEPPDVSEEMNAVPEVKPIEQSFAQMEVSSEQAECSAKMEVSTEQAESSAQKAEPPEHPEIALWKEHVKEWYTNLSEQAYFVPAVYMNRTQHKKEKVAGQEVYVLQPLSQDSDARDDAANNTVLRCIKQLARGQIPGVPKQVMFVISQLEFRNYLNNMTEQTQTRALPRAVDAVLHQQKKDEGDFDTLIIHREFGVIACEIRAVGENYAAIGLTEAKQIQHIERRVSSAVKRLEKSRVVLKHLVSDYPNPPRIRVMLMVPNISVEQLGKVLSKSKQLRERLCGSLGIDKARDPIPKCFTSYYVNNLADWWRQCVELDGPDSAMTYDLYLDLVARFGGPATTITVPCSTVPCLAKASCPVIRTLGDGVVETANRFAPDGIILHPTQLDVLHNEALEPLVYLCGPPGTGKTLILILRALAWIQEKRKPVHVVITRDGNMAASHRLNQKLKEMTKQTDSGQQQGIAEPAENPWVRLHRFELPIRMKPAVEELAKLESAGELFVIVDEACDVFSSGNNEKTFHDFCTQLRARVGKGLHLWAAAMYRKLKPPNFKEVVLKTAMRTPPSIISHVMQHRAIGRGKDVHGYEASSAPLPAYGPDPQVVLHEGPGHQDVKEPHDCEECGRKVAEVLDNLHVGKTGRLSKNSPQPPRNRDVILLTWDSCFHDNTTGKKARPASGLIRGLRQKGFPVTVLETGDADAVGTVATFSGSDEIVAAGSRFVQGMERMIVVYVETAQPVYYDLDWGRLCSMSLCTSQLIHVKPPDHPPRSGLQQTAAVAPKTSGDIQ